MWAKCGLKCGCEQQGNIFNIATLICHYSKQKQNEKQTSCFSTPIITLFKIKNKPLVFQQLLLGCLE